MRLRVADTQQFDFLIMSRLVPSVVSVQRVLRVKKEIDMARLSLRALAIGLMATGLMIPVGVALAQHVPIVVPVPQPQSPGSVTGTDPVPPPPPSGSFHRGIK
jgi:hypothetical protein